MQTVKIPVSIDLIRAASSNLVYQGMIGGQQLKRLNDMFSGDCADVNVSLECGSDLQGVVFLKGTAKTTLSLICQRCLSRFSVELKAEFIFGLCKTLKDVDGLPSEYDPIESNDDGEVHLHQLIEDELMVTAPVIPMHDEDVCRQGSQDLVIGEIEGAQEERPNPFAMLEKLKRK